MSGSRLVRGLLSGSVRRMVSLYWRWRLGLDGCWAEALGDRCRAMWNLWMRDWKLIVPFVFLHLISLYDIHINDPNKQ